MAISPELQKLLDTAWATMPTPVPYAQQPIQFLQPQVQQPVFQPIQIDTTLPTPYVSNVPTFQPIQLDPIQTQQFQPINFDWLMNSIWANQWIIAPAIQPSPIIIDNADFSPQENIINRWFQDAWYSSVQKAKSDIEAVAEAEQWRWFFWITSDIIPNIDSYVWKISAVSPIAWIVASWISLLDKWTETLKKNEIKNAWEKAKKINEQFWYNIVNDIQKQTANDSSIAQTTWNDWYKWVEKTLWWEWILNFNKNITKWGSNFSNVITPLISQKNNRSFELRLQWREEEAKQIEDVIDYNIIQARNNLQEQIQRISNIQNKDNTISDTVATDIASAEISKEYGSVNAFLKRWLKRFDWTTIDDATKRLDTNTREEFLNNQWNTLDLDTLSETSSNPLRILGGNIQKYIYNPLFQWTSRLIGEWMQAAWINNAAADAWFISDLWISERKQSMWDKVAAFSQEILDVVPELTTAVGTTLLTIPLQQINILKWVWFQSIWWLTKLNQTKAITNGLSQLWKTVLAESIQNGVFDAFWQNINWDVNYYANLWWGIVWSIPELYGLWKQWNKFYKIDEVKWMIKSNYIAEKMMKRLEEWKTIEEAVELRKWLTDEVIWKDYWEVDVNKIDKLTDWIDKSLEMERNIKQNANKRLQQIDKEILQTTDSLTLDALTSERNILSRTAQEYDEVVNFQIWQQAAIRNLLTKDNITAEDADYFARVIKTVLPNTRNEPLLREQILNLARWQRDTQIQDTLFKSFNDSSLKSSDQWYLVSQISKSTWLDVAKSYTLSEIDEVVKLAEKSSQFKWLSDTDVNGDLTYFNKIDWQKLVLNNEWLAKLNLTEQAPIFKIEREMGSLKEWTESAGYIKIANENKEVFWFTDEELANLTEWDVYNWLLEQIDNFIPCIR